MFEFKVRFYLTQEIVSAVFATHEEAINHLEHFKDTVQSFEVSVRNVAQIATKTKLPEFPKLQLYMIRSDVYQLCRPVDGVFNTSLNSVCIIRILEVQGPVDSSIVEVGQQI